MALRAHLGGITSQHGLLACIASSSSVRVQFHPCFHRATRGYAAASATLRKKTPVTANVTRKDARTQPQPPPQNSASRKHEKTTSETATLRKKTPVTAKGTRKDARTPQPPPQNAASRKHKKTTSAEKETAPTDAVAKEHSLLKDLHSHNMTEEQTKELDKMLVMAQFMPTIDPWGQEVRETLDVMIPYHINYKTFSREIFKQITGNLTNSFKNAAALSTLKSANSIPGVTMLYGKPLLERIRDITQNFSTQSVKPDSLLTPFRQMALELYIHKNEATAKRNEKDLLKLTTFSYQKDALEMLKFYKTKHSNMSLFWEMHRECEPTRLLSLRVIQGHLGDEEPRFGNRLMIHALFKFDTEQSLEIYNQQGQPLHVPASGAERSSDQRIPAQRKRVTEYLVMEKRMWLQGPWLFREQLWPQ